MSIKLTYFDLPGRAFAIRACLLKAGVPFEDVRVKFPELVEKRGAAGFNSQVPLGQLPILEIDGKVLVQSVAMARFAAKKAGMYPADDVKALLVDSVLETVNDMSASAPQDPDKEVKKTKREAWTQNKLPMFLNYLENNIDDEGPYMFGKELGLADLFLFNTVNSFKTAGYDYVPATAVDGYPKLNRLYEAAKDNEVVKKGLV